MLALPRSPSRFSHSIGADPDTIGPAKYRLQLVIKDRQRDKFGHASVAFEIRGAAR
jgi:hypothetical protein